MATDKLQVTDTPLSVLYCTHSVHVCGFELQEVGETINPLKPKLKPICYLLALLADGI